MLMMMLLMLVETTNPREMLRQEQRLMDAARDSKVSGRSNERRKPETSHRKGSIIYRTFVWIDDEEGRQK